MNHSLHHKSIKIRGEYLPGGRFRLHQSHPEDIPLKKCRLQHYSPDCGKLTLLDINDMEGELKWCN
jgi:hypothetical protein